MRLWYKGKLTSPIILQNSNYFFVNLVKSNMTPSKISYAAGMNMFLLAYSHLPLSMLLSLCGLFRLPILANPIDNNGAKCFST